MHSPSELADWWDKNKKESEKALEDFVDEHPHFWGVAATVQTFMDVGAGFVDVLRFGEGMAESYDTGKVWPAVQDLFRGLTIASGAAKVLGSSAVAGRVGTWIGRSTNIGGNMPGLYLDVAPSRGICAPIATANAIRRTGNALMLNKNLMMSLDEIAVAHGRPGIMAAESLNMDQSISALRALGIPHEVIPSAGSWENIVKLAEQRRGVVMIRVVNSAGGGAHRIVVEAAEGGVQIIDRTGIYKCLDGLSKRYETVLNKGKWVVDGAKKAVLVKSVTVRVVKGIPTLMAYVDGLIPKLHGDMTVQELDTKFQQFKAQHPNAGSAAKPVQAGASRITVRPGDTLSGLAGKYYGSTELWPLLWDANRGLIGVNPNLISPGVVLSLPPLSSFTPEQLAAARRRNPSWRSYALAGAR